MGGLTINERLTRLRGVHGKFIVVSTEIPGQVEEEVNLNVGIVRSTINDPTVLSQTLQQSNLLEEMYELVNATTPDMKIIIKFLLLSLPYNNILRHLQASKWYTILEQSVPTSKEAFWKTIKRWTNEPQLIIPPIEKCEIIPNKKNDNDDIKERDTLYETDNKDAEESSSHDKNNKDDIHLIETIARQLIPKRKSKDPLLIETVSYFENNIKDGYEGRVIYKPCVKSIDELPFYYPKVMAYSLKYTLSNSKLSSDPSGILQLQLLTSQYEEKPVINDLKMQYALKTIIHKLFKWCIQSRIGYIKKAHHDSIIPKDDYLKKYNEIKAKYADVIVSNWTEKTDPKKFVYEDLAIASYLICLWEKDEKKLSKSDLTFIDLGCGNGLLTYLLTKEGYNGYGVDMVDRKIWKNFNQENNNDILKVESIYPSQVKYQVDWIIGNHADELVPWIPIIAAKSGVDCKFIVIPCCFYGLDGKRNLPLTKDEGGKYRAYTNYIKGIASQCGFNCDEDYLRIPSTKNIALIGQKRKRMIDNEELVKIQAPGIGFTIRKSDYEKEELRRLDKKLTFFDIVNSAVVPLALEPGNSSGNNPAQDVTPSATHSESANNPPASSTQQQPTTTNAPPPPPPSSTEVKPTPTPTTTPTPTPNPTTPNTPPPSSSAQQTTTAAPPPASSNNPPPSSNNPPSSHTNNHSSNNSSPSNTDSSTGSNPSSSATNSPNDQDNGKSSSSGGSSTGTIVGAVVGGVVGLALIGGLLAWLNRRGGCASRSNKRSNNDFEDFGLAESDFPHNRSPPMTAAALGTGAALGAGTAAVASTVGSQSPNINNNNANTAYYNNGAVPPPADYDSGRHYAPYQPQIDEYNVQYQQQPQQQQGYYYPQQEQQYYDEQYYYENSPNMANNQVYDHNQGGYDPNQAYDHNQAPLPHQQQQQPYATNDYYKPDQIDKPNERY
ncbi:unnamed protein product [Cunninghamella blakesleeana]